MGPLSSTEVISVQQLSAIVSALVPFGPSVEQFGSPYPRPMSRAHEAHLSDWLDPALEASEASGRLGIWAGVCVSESVYLGIWGVWGILGVWGIRVGMGMEAGMGMEVGMGMEAGMGMGMGAGVVAALVWAGFGSLVLGLVVGLQGPWGLWGGGVGVGVRTVVGAGVAGIASLVPGSVPMV